MRANATLGRLQVVAAPLVVAQEKIAAAAQGVIDLIDAIDDRKYFVNVIRC